ncbi:TetR family transcriptional regulator [Janibacter sp. GS2]|uniref:TetR family transcriptional regulator n=1 Tax=Janibacter sp. GS2 TaxID=3442646 RepID=UPI003EBBC56D
MNVEGTPSHRLALGGSVRDLRQRRGMTLRQLSREMGTSVGTLSAIENGKVGTSSHRVVQLADALGVRADLLLTGVGQPIHDGRWLVRGFAGPGNHLEGWRSYDALILDPALHGALESFLEFGYHGSTMRGIAERAGLSVAGLYHYYESKQQMLVALFDRTMSELAGRTTAARSAPDEPWTRFAKLVECLALFHTHRRELGFIGASEMRSLAQPARQRIAQLRTTEQAKVDVELLAACRAGVFATDRPHEAARSVVTMCTSMAQWYRSDGPSTPEELAGQYVDFALDLVRCDESLRPRQGPLTPG